MHSSHERLILPSPTDPYIRNHCGRQARATEEPRLPHGTFGWSYATFLFLSAAQAYLRWILDGATKAAQFSVDSFRRSQAEQRLSAATAEAETARAGLAGVDDLIAFQEGVVRILEGRRDEFVRAVVVEATGSLAKEYEETTGRLADIAMQLGGAAHALRRRIDTVDRALPGFGFANARLLVNERDMKRASSRWADLEKKLRDDPRATLRAD